MIDFCFILIICWLCVLYWLINSVTTLLLVVWTMNERTNERIKEWMNERTNEQMDGWIKKRMEKRMNEWTNARTHERSTNARRMNEWMIASMNIRTDKHKDAVAWSAPGKKYYQTMVKTNLVPRCSLLPPFSRSAGTGRREPWERGWVNTLARLFYLRHPSDMMVILVFQNILYHTYRTTLTFLVSSHSENFSLLLVHLKDRGLFHRDTSSML